MKKQCCGSEMFIPDPNISIPGPGYRIIKIPDSGSASKNSNIFTPKTVSKLSVPGPGFGFFSHPDPGSRGPKMHRILIRNSEKKFIKPQCRESYFTLV
jgi:hypothetical protein